MKQGSSPRLRLLAAMALFGTIGLFRRAIPLGSATIAMVRGFIGAGFLLLVRLLRKENFSLADTRGCRGILLLSGFCLGANWILLFEAYRYTTVAVATLCYYMAPIFMILTAPFLFREALTVRKGLCVAAAFCGMVLVSGVLNPGGAASDYRGILMGLGAAVLYAAVVILNKKTESVSVENRTTVQLLVSGMLLLPYVLLTERISAEALRPSVLLLVLIVGIVHTGLAYSLYFGSIRGLPAQTVALFSYVDPVVAILLSALLLAEPFGIREGLGTVLILGAAILSER